MGEKEIKELLKEDAKSWVHWYSVHQEFKRIVSCHPTQESAGKELGISQSYLNQVLRGSRGISKNLAEKLGYEKQEVFVKIDD